MSEIKIPTQETMQKLHVKFKAFWKQKNEDDQDDSVGFPEMWEKANDFIENIQEMLFPK